MYSVRTIWKKELLHRGETNSWIDKQNSHIPPIMLQFNVCVFCECLGSAYVPCVLLPSYLYYIDLLWNLALGLRTQWTTRRVFLADLADRRSTFCSLYCTAEISRAEITAEISQESLHSRSSSLEVSVYARTWGLVDISHCKNIAIFHVSTLN